MMTIWQYADEIDQSIEHARRMREVHQGPTQRERRASSEARVWALLAARRADKAFEQQPQQENV